MDSEYRKQASWLWRVAAGVAFAGPLCATPSMADAWSSFQNGGRVASEVSAPGLPKLGPESRAAWQAEIVGYGQSTPVSDGKRVYTTSVSGGNKEKLHVQCFDRASGEELWRHELANSTPEPNNTYVSRAAPSPACDEQGVVALFEGGNVVALAADGSLRWQRDLVADYGAITARHGIAASVEQDRDRVYLWIERQQEPYLVALDKATGDTVWKSEGLGTTSWSSPRLVSVGDSHHVVVSAVGTLGGYDAETGDRLWTLDGIVGNSAPTPVPLGGGRLLLGATTGRGGAGGAAAESNGVVEIRRTEGGGYTADYVWRAERATSSFGSPIAVGRHAYFVNRSGVVYCLDLENGEELYAKRSASSVWATPFAAGGLVYLPGKQGKITVLKSGPEFEVVAEAQAWEDESPEPGRRGLGGPVLYAAAPVGDSLLLRRGDRLYCFR